MRKGKVSDAAATGQHDEGALDDIPSIGKRNSTDAAKEALLRALGMELSQQAATIDLYKKIMETSVKIMDSQYATIQLSYPDREGHEKLRVVASSGLSPEAENYWKWVYHHTSSSCGEVLRTRRRVIVPDYRVCEFMQDAATLSAFIDGGIFAAQSTPLYSNKGKLLGMISTHWAYPHIPPQSNLDLMDVLASHAVDFIERVETPGTLKERKD
jgi:hypothetical protein